MDLEEALRTVTTQGWLSATSPDFQRAVLSGCDCRPLEAGAPLQAGGEDHGEMIGLARGILELRTTLGPADTAIMHFAHPVFWLGFVPTLFKQPRRVAAAAKTRAWLVRVPEATLRRTLKENPQWWAFFLQPLLEYGDLTVTIAADLMIRDSARRCAAALLRLAGCRYAGPQDVTPVEVPRTQNEPARAANLSRNSVGTMLQLWNDDRAGPCGPASVRRSRLGRWSASDTPSAISDGGTGVAMTPCRRRVASSRDRSNPPEKAGNGDKNDQKCDCIKTRPLRRKNRPVRTETRTFALLFGSD